MLLGQLKIAATSEEWGEEIGDDLHEYFHQHPLFPEASGKKSKLAHEIPVLKENQKWQKSFVGSYVNHKDIPHVLNELKKQRMKKPIYDPKNQNIIFSDNGLTPPEVIKALNQYKQ